MQATSISNEDDPETSSSITAYPNPVEDKITILLNNLSPDTKVSLIQSSGITLKEERPVRLDHTIDMSSMPAGLYFIRVSDVNTRSTIKVLKR
ncbi:MAG TPA: T9SS type A sorting domain-containing protein [Chryseosolibacter sp.]|nr:T9SS type A sorting domain-containing protein [Chryseosolibacter sp.]